jgi:hypothetical protein
MFKVLAVKKLLSAADPDLDLEDIVVTLHQTLNP